MATAPPIASACITRAKSLWMRIHVPTRKGFDANAFQCELVWHLVLIQATLLDEVAFSVAKPVGTVDLLAVGVRGVVPVLVILSRCRRGLALGNELRLSILQNL